MEFIAIYLFLAVCLLLMLGYPVAFTLAGTALAFATGGVLFGVGTGLIIGAIRMLAEARRIGRWLREERRHRLSARGGMLELRF